MTEHQLFVQLLETLGYYPLPRPHAGSPGFGGLLVILRQAPHGHEPERIDLRLREWNGLTPQIHLHAGTDQAFAHAVCPGRIVIRSRQEREVTFFSFGGTLESDALTGETVYSIRSSAPILELTPERETVADLLAGEAEGLFARAEAKLNLKTQRLLNRLLKAGPESVYLSVLQTLLAQTAVPHRSDFTKMLHQERDWFQQTGRWPILPHDLETLLQKIDEQ